MVRRKVALESTLQAKVEEYLKSVGAYVIKMHASSFQSVGEPDIVCCYKGKFYAFELKSGSNITAIQQMKINLIKRSGGVAMEVHDIQQIIDAGVI